MVKPATISLSVFARELGLTSRSVTRYAQEGMPTRLVNGERRVSRPDAHRWLLETAEARGRAKASSGSLEDAELRLQTAKAKKAELELGELEGKLVPVAAYQKEFGWICAQLRGAILAMPRYAPRFVQLETPAQAQAVLREVAADVLGELQKATDGEDEDDEASA